MIREIGMDNANYCMNCGSKRLILVDHNEEGDDNALFVGVDFGANDETFECPVVCYCCLSCQQTMYIGEDANERDS